MKAPLSWLREYVTVDATADEMAERLFTSALQVDEVSDVGVPDVDGNVGRFLVGRVLEVGAHPNADRLRVCQVDVGEGDARQIVCGAWNFEAGCDGRRRAARRATSRSSTSPSTSASCAVRRRAG